MAYRLTTTDKWDDKWFRSLNPLKKIMFIFLCDKCDLAGFYEIDLEDLSFRVKAEEEEISEMEEEDDIGGGEDIKVYEVLLEEGEYQFVLLENGLVGMININIKEFISDKLSHYYVDFS